MVLTAIFQHPTFLLANSKQVKAKVFFIEEGHVFFFTLAFFNKVQLLPRSLEVITATKRGQTPY